MHVLTHIAKNYRHTGILTNRQIKFLCRVEVFKQSAHYLFGQLIGLGFFGTGYTAAQIVR